MKATRYEVRVVKVKCVCEDPKDRICGPDDALPFLETIRNQDQEHFLCCTLNSEGGVINCRVVTIGLLNTSLVHPREVFRGAVADNARTVIVAHNHPSGSLEPSSQDIAITTQLKEAGEVLGINLLDHIIVTKAGHLSMREKGLI